MTYKRPKPGAQWMYFVDSSVLNGPGSGSFGGFGMFYEGSGLMDWRCFAPKRLSESSATAELIMATAASKAASQAGAPPQLAAPTSAFPLVARALAAGGAVWRVEPE